MKRVGNLGIDKNSEIGKAQIKALKHFETMANKALAKTFKGYRLVKDVDFEIIFPKDVGEIEMRLNYTSPGTKDSFNLAVKETKKQLEDDTND